MPTGEAMLTDLTGWLQGWTRNPLLRRMKNRVWPPSLRFLWVKKDCSLRGCKNCPEQAACEPAASYRPLFFGSWSYDSRGWRRYPVSTAEVVKLQMRHLILEEGIILLRRSFHGCKWNQGSSRVKENRVIVIVMPDQKIRLVPWSWGRAA